MKLRRRRFSTCSRARLPSPSAAEPSSQLRHRTPVPRRRRLATRQRRDSTHALEDVTLQQLAGLDCSFELRVARFGRGFPRRFTSHLNAYARMPRYPVSSKTQDVASARGSGNIVTASSPTSSRTACRPDLDERRRCGDLAQEEASRNSCSTGGSKPSGTGSTMKEPTWSHVHYKPIDYQDISSIILRRALPLNAPKSLDEVDPKLLATYARSSASRCTNGRAWQVLRSMPFLTASRSRPRSKRSSARPASFFAHFPMRCATTHELIETLPGHGGADRR